MARKKKHEEHENHERWLVSYADFITLLFAFFVVMYSISSLNEGKYRTLSDSIVSAFRSSQSAIAPIRLGKPTRPEVTDKSDIGNTKRVAVPVENPVTLPLRSMKDKQQATRSAADSPEKMMGEAMKELADQIEKAMAPLIEQDLVTVRSFRYWLEVEIKTNILFSSGSAELQSTALPVLRNLVAILGKYPNPVHVEGFTDNVPIKTVLYPSNWELSVARAMSVVHMFSNEGLDPGRLAAVGYGEHKPVAPNDTKEGRAKNRKVVLVIMADDKASRMRDANPSGNSPDITGPLSSSESVDPALRPEMHETNQAAAVVRDATTIPAKTNPRLPGG